MDMHEDESADIELIKSIIGEALDPVVTVIKQMLDKMGAMDEEIDKLSQLVNEEILGGITNLYKTKERQGGISSLSEKYGSLMGPYKDFYSEMTDGADLYEKLYDELDEFKASAEEVDDAAVDAKVAELAEILKNKFEKVKGLSGPEVEVEVKTEEEPKEEEKEDPFAKIRAMKARVGDKMF